MIKSFRHKGLRRLFESNDHRGLDSALVPRISKLLLALDAADSVEELDLPGFRLHPLRGDLHTYWSIRVSGNWRLVFRFEQGSAFNVDFVDYH